MRSSSVIRYADAKKKDSQDVSSSVSVLDVFSAPKKPLPVLAIICRESQETVIGEYVSQLAGALAQKRRTVHIFCQKGFTGIAGVVSHEMGACSEGNLFEQIETFTSRVGAEFERTLGTAAFDVTLLGHEWSSIPTLLKLGDGRKTVLALQSLERQRSDMKSDLNRRIEKIEIDGINAAKILLVQDERVADAIRKLVPSAANKLSWAQRPLSFEFNGKLDAGAVKREYNLGPIDPVVLFIGDLDHQHGPDLIMKSVVAILKKHAHARFIFVGDGEELWPLRVYAHYLYLEDVVRIPGHIEGQDLRELILASDIIAVPSRGKTSEWPVLAAWASKKPVIVTQTAGLPLCRHEENALVIEPKEEAFTQAVDRMLTDFVVHDRIIENGSKELSLHFGWNRAAEQFESMMGVSSEVSVTVEQPKKPRTSLPAKASKSSSAVRAVLSLGAATQL